MPGSPRHAASTAASRHDRLLATKLFVPHLPAGFVVRPRLLERLDEVLSVGLLLVSAPAGFGKTAILADWARHHPVAWLTLDPADNDPTRFWRHALAALDAVRPGMSDRVGPVLGPPAPPTFEGLVTVLINDVAGAADQADVVLVLDDYHVIDARDVHESIAFLLDHRPRRLHLVILGRADPPLPLARIRADGQLAELRADDLRFTVDEAAALVRGSLDLPLPDGAVAALATRTEGWAAGLQLAALSLRRSSDPTGFVEAFSGSHRHVLDYLSEEVLERQSASVRRFLLETSVLERLSAGLCDAVTGRTDSRTVLESIERANLFVVPLDDERGWWRYHRLFADLLRVRLQHESPDRVPGLHRNAAGWYDEHGLPDDAIGHALAAADPAWAARLIERQVDAFLLRNEEATLEHWIAALPADLVTSRPRLMLARADMALSRGEFEAVEQALDGAERALAATRDEPYEPSVGRASSLVANVPAAVAFWRAYVAELRGDADGAVASDELALVELGDGDSVMASAARLHLRAARLLRGEMCGAERDLRSSVAELRAAGEVYPALRAIELLGHVQRAQGRLAAALETYQRGMRFAVADGRAPSPAAGIAYVGVAEVAYQRGELDVALEHATQGIRLCRSLAYRRPLAAGLATVARIRWAEGDQEGALQAIAEDPTVASSVGVTGLLNPMPALRVRLQLAAGDLAAAIRWARERGLGSHDEVTYPREPEHLVLARILLEEDRHDEALALLDRLHRLATDQERIGSVIEIDTLRAVARAAAGDRAGALDSLSDALVLAHPQGYVRVFADEGPLLGALLTRLVAAQRTEPARARRIPLAYLGRLLRACERRPNAGDPTRIRRGVGIPGLVEALSEREMEVLRLLAEGKANQEIAGELYVALDTVKKHVSHILGKLGATNRTEATARARELGLLADR